MYASDYPHRHVSDPLDAFLPHLPESLARKIRGENAREWYRLKRDS
jgi:predicted TIM-barrel fold metal-dependent hydrolase